MNEGQKELMKALHYLDYGKLKQGERCLNRAIESAEADGEFTTFMKAAVCYGELLAQFNFVSFHTYIQICSDRAARRMDRG